MWAVTFECLRQNVLRIKKLGSTDSHWFLSYRGKSPEKPKRFFWSVQGSLRGNRNPLRLFFFCQRFLLEKQKKMLCRTCKFAAVHRPLCSFPETPEASPHRGRLFPSKKPLPCGRGWVLLMRTDSLWGTGGTSAGCRQYLSLIHI